MTIYTCDKCNQEFKQKNDYNRHINKKYPCITQEEFKEKLSEYDSLKQLDSFFTRMHDILRDYESITGDKALDVITDFLFLRLLNYDENMNFITKQYNKKIKIEEEDFDLDEYKKYFKWSELIKIVNNIDKNSSDQESKLLITNVIQHIIFNGIFKFNEHTKDIYRNRRFYVKKLTTIIKLLKEYNKIEFDKFDVDIKGKAYELTIQKETSKNKTFSQFFTPRWIDKYMILNVDIQINKDGSYTKIKDPACGTAGILCEYFSEVKNRAEKNDIIIDNNVSKYIYGTEIVDDTLKIAHMNILLKSGRYNTNLKCKDFLESECLDYIDDKFDGNIVMNPPFAITKNYDFTNGEYKKIFHTETKSGTMLFLMASLNSIKNGRQLILVSPNGQEISNKKDEFVNIRKNIIENTNLYKIVILPEGSFKPYTCVQTLILMMRKGEKTKEIQFVKVAKNKDDTTTETKICTVKYKELIKKNYSWNYMEYYSEQIIKYDNIEYKELKEICNFQNGKFTTENMDNNGIFDFYSGEAIQPIGKHSNFCYDGDKYIIMIRSGGSKGKYGDNIGLGKVFLVSNKTAGTSPTIKIEIKNNIKNIIIEYLHKYLKLKKNEITDLAHYTTSLGRISKDDLETIQIPIPPIEIQNIIVKELDSMYKQKENLQNAINEMNTFHKVQFDILLSKCIDKKTVKIGNIISFKAGNFNTSNMNNNGNYNFYNASIKNPIGKHDEYCFDGDEYIIFIKSGGNANNKVSNTHALGLSLLVFGKIACVCDVLKVNINDDIIKTKFMFNYLKNLKDRIQENAHYTTSLGHCNMEYIKNIEIQIPSIEDQQHIIEQMETLDTLVSLQEKQIDKINKVIKERFEYHLEKCKNSVKEDKEKDKVTELVDIVDKEVISKTSKKIKDNDIITTKKTTKSNKNNIVEEVKNDDESHLEKELEDLPKFKKNKNIIIDDDPFKASTNIDKIYKKTAKK